MTRRFPFSDRAWRIAKGGVAVGAALLLVTGAARLGAAADRAAGTPAATVTTPIAHAIDGSRDSYADVVDVVTPAVVTIHIEGKATMSPTQFQGQGPDNGFLQRFFEQQFGQQSPYDDDNPAPRQFQQPRRQSALGSGVIVTTDGYILTNYHVVDGADHITVEQNDGRTYTAKVIGTDKPSDLALIKVNGHFTAVAMGNSDAVKVGDVVLAVGNPLGVGETVTMGIISAKGRSTGVGDGSYEDFLQTDAPINHGNSGGALVNTKGELIGINSQILSTSDGNIGIGFAIPINMAKNVMTQLRTSGKVTRAQLGVTIQQVSSQMADSLGLKESGGAIVSSVRAGSPADRAGVKQGDVIVSFDGQPVHDSNTLRNRVAATAPGSRVDIGVVRDGAETHLTAKLEELNGDALARNDESGANGDSSALGVSVAPLTPELASRMGAAKDARGVVVQDVNPNGRAADAGIQSGDVIESVNRRPVRNVEELRDALKVNSDRPALLLVNRGGNEVFLTVAPANG